VPQLLKEFLKETTIKFCGVAIANDLRMLRTYGTVIPSVYDLQKIVPNPTNKLTPSLYDLANATIGGTRRRTRRRRTRRSTRRREKKKMMMMMKMN
jgi:hypothetical protein